jgi:hypothetical protein
MKEEEGKIECDPVKEIVEVRKSIARKVVGQERARRIMGIKGKGG